MLTVPTLPRTLASIVSFNLDFPFVSFCKNLFALCALSLGFFVIPEGNLPNACFSDDSSKPGLGKFPSGMTKKGAAQTPTDTLRLLQTLPVKAAFAATDNLSNVYLITPENAVEKYAPDGRLLGRYTNNRLGQAARLDASNPLKVLAWYADFRVVVFLDRSLTALGELNLIDAGYPEVRNIAAAQDGNLWVYDEVNFRLVKITPEGDKRCESQSLNLLETTLLQPSCLRENNDRVFLADSTQGVYMFDLFAQFDRFFVPMQPIRDFQVVDNQIHYLTDGKIVAEHLQVRANKEVRLPATISKGKVVILSPRRVLVVGERVEVYGY